MERDIMPYDYYEILKKQIESDEYIETTDLVRQNIWNESFEFELSNEWLIMEDLIKRILYLYLRYN